MTPTERAKLDGIIKEAKEKEDNSFDKMTFLRKHNFPFEETAIRLQYEAYHEIRLLLEMFRDNVL